MSLKLAKSWRVVGCAVMAGTLLAACALDPPGLSKKRKRSPVDPGDDYYDDVPSGVSPIEPDEVNGTSGAFGPASERPAPEAGTPTNRPDAGDVPSDAGSAKVFCAPAVRPGDLAVVEIMISSKAGSGDTGEWAEIQNTQTCWLHLAGVSVESPRGAADPNVATFAGDVELEPGGTFVVAGSADPAKNNGLGGTLISWNAADVLKNDGDSLIVKLGMVEIDRVTYPAFNNLTAGRALAFPGDCAWPQRADWARWSLAFTAFAPGFQGTPNGDNADVTCF